MKKATLLFFLFLFFPPALFYVLIIRKERKDLSKKESRLIKIKRFKNELHNR